VDNVPETYLEKWASIILLCLRLRHRYVIRNVENVISKCRHYYKLTCIQAHFVADACQRCLSAVGVSVTGTPNVAQHGFVLPQINNPLYFTVLYLLLLTSFVKRVILNNLQNGINKAGITVQ